MDIFTAIKTRKSVREYLDIPIPEDLIAGIVEAGSFAPSAGDKQNWKFVVVRDQSRKNDIATDCNEQYWMAKAPVHIVICSDEGMNQKFFGKRSQLYSIQNCAVAAENMLLAAHSMDIGACFVSQFDEIELANDIGLSSNARVQGIITLGYPTEHEVHKRQQKKLHEVMNFESYGSSVKDFSPWLFDWSKVMTKNIDRFTDDIKTVFLKEFKEYSDEIEKHWKKISKKIKEVLKKKL